VTIPVAMPATISVTKTVVLTETNNRYFEDVFSKLTHAKSQISGTEFEDCEFNDSDFSEAVFEHCKFVSCTFKCCNLSLLKVPHCRLVDVNFVQCKPVD
jgi:uncharacterized protein YjbI with pentapeptide repeats